MPRLRLLLVALASLAGFAFAGSGTAFAAGSIQFDSAPGTGPPPLTLGPYAMTAFGADPQPFGITTGVAGPTGTVSFSPFLDHVRVGQGWATWSNGYFGDVYPTDGGTSATLTLPPGTSAFYLYAEPDPFAIFDVTATAQDGTTSGPIAVEGQAGAQYFGFYGTGGAKVASITITSDIDFAVGEFGIGTGSALHRNYVALGDSYSSGEGDPPFISGTNGPSDYCHRSPLAYSEVLGASIGSMPSFYACSGAVTSDITSTFHDTEPPQITRAGVDPSADLVTMTIGGNDAGFSGVLKSCIEQKLKADAYNTFVVGKFGQWLGLGHDESCAHSSSFVSSVNTNVDNVFWPVKTTELELLSAVDPVKTSVIVAGYPKLFPSDSDAQNCAQLDFWLTNDDQDFMNAEGDRLIGVLQEAAAEAGVNFVDVRGAFAGHEICGAGGSYLNAITLASGSGSPCTWSIAGHCIIPGGPPIIGSFHPNSMGHASGYAAAISAAINSAAVRTPAGFPRNPFPTPDPPGQPVPPPVRVGELTAQEVTQTPDCAGTLQAGQVVQVSGGGFAPGADVQLLVSSFAFAPTGEQQVGGTSADSAGNISATLRIPLSATGFTPPGATAGLVFIDAIGLGVGGTHQDDNAMLGLEPHDGLCGTVDTLPFSGFTPPVANPPDVNDENAGRAIPVKFSTPGVVGTLDQVLAAGYPQSAAVSCSAPGSPTTGDPTVQNGGSSSPSDSYNYVWKTDKSFTGCRVLIVKLVDGSYHRAVFNFGS